MAGVRKGEEQKLRARAEINITMLIEIHIIKIAAVIIGWSIFCGLVGFFMALGLGCLASAESADEWLEQHEPSDPCNLPTAQPRTSPLQNRGQGKSVSCTAAQPGELVGTIKKI